MQVLQSRCWFGRKPPTYSIWLDMAAVVRIHDWKAGPVMRLGMLCLLVCFSYSHIPRAAASRFKIFRQYQHNIHNNITDPSFQAPPILRVSEVTDRAVRGRSRRHPAGWPSQSTPRQAGWPPCLAMWSRRPPQTDGTSRPGWHRLGFPAAEPAAAQANRGLRPQGHMAPWPCVLMPPTTDVLAGRHALLAQIPPTLEI